jgi:hypothetical protein
VARGQMRLRARLGSVLALCLLVTGCGGASGGTVHRTPAGGERAIGEFGSLGSGAGQLDEPIGVAFDPRGGGVYVVDTENARVERFTSVGKFRLAWGWGVADGRTRAPQTCTRRCFPGLPGAGRGQFHAPEGIAADDDASSPSYGDLYVVDVGNDRVEKFTPGGRFLLTFGSQVNKTAHAQGRRSEEDVCGADRGEVCGPGAEGAGGTALEPVVEGTFIAVGPGGDVYVGQRNSVSVYSPAGVLRSRVELTPPLASREGELGGVSALAVNSSGDMYVVRNGVVGVKEYAPGGDLLRTLEPAGPQRSYSEGPTPSLALGPSGDVFVDVFAFGRHWVDEYGPAGAELARFDEGKKAPVAVVHREDALPGMAYDPGTGWLYLVSEVPPGSSACVSSRRRRPAAEASSGLSSPEARHSLPALLERPRKRLGVAAIGRTRPVAEQPLERRHSLCIQWCRAVEQRTELSQRGGVGAHRISLDAHDGEGAGGRLGAPQQSLQPLRQRRARAPRG